MRLPKTGPVLALLLTIAAILAADTSAVADEAGVERHGASLFGNLKYPPDFKHFDYVNVNAPKGGELRYAAIGTFDSLNGFIVKGSQAAGLSLIYDTLLESSLDEPSSEYGLVAQSLSYPADYSSVTFTLRPEARFNDGTPITAEDVIWSFQSLKKLNPFYSAYYHNVTKAEAMGAHKVRFSFATRGNRELPQIMGQLPVLPKHYWTGKDAAGRARDISRTTLDAPLGSGPYRIAQVVPGRTIVYERVKDYWARNLPAKIGTANFDRMRFDYFGDPTIAFEAFKGDQVDFRLENSSKNWAISYDIPPVKDGRIVREMLPKANGAGMQSFAFNLRRDLFKDERVREAFNWAFDFEWQNKNLFYGQYTRTGSFFANSELASSGVPGGAELKLLVPFKTQLPPELFTTPYKNPSTDGSGNNRANLRRAAELLDAAGWTAKSGMRVDAKTGKPLAVEFLLADPMFERVVGPYKQSLERLGIKVTLRTVDSAQYQNRVDNRDFDIIVASFPESLSPGNEQRDFWGCDAAKTSGSRNVIGICDPVVEKLVDAVIFAKSRDELLTATHALDRVLLWRHYVVPQWYLPYERVAYWARLAHPKPTPTYSIGFPDIWWYDAEGKAARKASTAP
ncbi:MAG: extracellular solute-binding protein [Parvibaculum sp.]|uniref:extracellular solute-binding protein n=1 Tax=Parvibaculum sp. TaxID=2024848 RepID=UPI00284A3447|nr:extracellular solute-binding protein [Parvibaculum sp.]MDR3500054.1 extracellular solute-binding protein [Parvibaculum sp.]